MADTTTEPLPSTMNGNVSSSQLIKPSKDSAPKRRPFVLDFGVNRVIGSRNYQEDEYTCIDGSIIAHRWSAQSKPAYFAIFDGHGSDDVSAHASKHMHELLFNSPEFQQGDIKSALINAFAKEDARIGQKGVSGGATATVALLVDGVLHLANVGDSRAVLAARGGTEGTLRAIRLSRDHKPDDPDEKQRIEANGGLVMCGRVRGEQAAINMSRALGDHDFKLPHTAALGATGDFITWKPHLSRSVPIDENIKFLIVASDGLWGFYEDQQAVDTVDALLREGKDPEEVATVLANKCGERRGADNTTVIIVRFHWGLEHAPSRKPKVSGAQAPGIAEASRPMGMGAGAFMGASNQ